MVFFDQALLFENASTSIRNRHTLSMESEEAIKPFFFFCLMLSLEKSMYAY